MKNHSNSLRFIAVALLFTVLSFNASLTSSAQIQYIADTSLEISDTASGAWTSTSSNFGSVLCDSSCLNCGGPCIPHSGEWYAWFGGAYAAETGTLSQTVNLTADGIGSMSFWVAMPNPMLAEDSLKLLFDSVMVWGTGSSDSLSYTSVYSNVTVSLGNLSSGTHQITFVGEEHGGSGPFNILVDDITLWVGSGSALTDYDFENGITLFANYSENVLYAALNLDRPQSLQIRVMDVLGRILSINDINNSANESISWNTSAWPTGVYFVVFCREKDVVTKKIFIP